MAVQTKILLRRDTATNWTNVNPTLAAGEFGFDTTNKRLKIGDGTTAWGSLGYLKAGTATTLETARLINNVSFDGSADITVTAAAGTLTGTTLNSIVVNSSLTKIGALSSGTAGFVKVDASGNLTSDSTSYLATSTIGSTVQGYDADLQAIGALSGTTGYLKKTAANTWSLDTSTFILSSAIGSTVQAWDADLDAIGALSGTSGYLKKTAANTWILDTSTPLTASAIGSTIQAWDADLDAIAALSGTTGILSKTAANTWTLDTNSYLQTANLNSYTTYLGTTALTLARTSNNIALTGILSVSLAGSTSGATLLKPSAVAGSTTITLPAVTGTVITTGDTGTVTDTMLATGITGSKITGAVTKATNVVGTLAVSGTRQLVQQTGTDTTSLLSNPSQQGQYLSGGGAGGSGPVWADAPVYFMQSGRAAVVNGTATITFNTTFDYAPIVTVTTETTTTPAMVTVNNVTTTTFNVVIFAGSGASPWTSFTIPTGTRYVHWHAIQQLRTSAGSQ